MVMTERRIDPRTIEQHEQLHEQRRGATMIAQPAGNRTERYLLPMIIGYAMSLPASVGGKRRATPG
jgi:hypothetical protein